MKTKIIPITALIAGVAIAFSGWIFFGKPDQRETAAPAPAGIRTSERPDAVQAPPRAPQPPALSPVTAEADAASPAAPPAGKIPAAATAQSGSLAAPVPSAKRKAKLQAPLARAAMCFVGADPDAESVWLGAIFNPSIPDKEREDLIEDLNEEGLSDPKRPGPQDYLLIMNRLSLIDEIVPDADKFMRPHLNEARKDLLNLAARIQGEGKPVR